MERVERLERLTNLVLVLLDAGRPLSLQEIADTVPGYPAGGDARRQAVERDKRTLRTEAIPIVIETAADGQPGYRIRAEDYYLPDLRLTHDEQVALNLAVAGVHLDDRSGRGAMLKLGLVDAGRPPAVAALPSLPSLGALHEAVGRRAAVSFAYRGERRAVDPYGLVFRRGSWYLVGRDHDRDELRTFRVDRIEGSPTAGPAGSYELPPDEEWSAALRLDPWRLGEGEATTAHVLVDADLAASALAELGDEALVERRPDGSVVVTLEVSNADGLRSWVLGFLDHAEVLSPPALRQEMADWLAALALDPA